MVMQIKLVVVVVACALIVTDTCVKFDTRCSPENRVISVTYSVAREYSHNIKLAKQDLPGRRM